MAHACVPSNCAARFERPRRSHDAPAIQRPSASWSNRISANQRFGDGCCSCGGWYAPDAWCCEGTPPPFVCEGTRTVLMRCVLHRFHIPGTEQLLRTATLIFRRPLCPLPYASVPQVGPTMILSILPSTTKPR